MGTSSTFSRPSPQPQTLPDLYDWQSQHSADHPLFVYKDGDKHTSITMAVGVQGVHRATQYSRNCLGQDAPRSQSKERPVVAIIARADTITYQSTALGIMRTGRAVFPIHPRNGVVAISSLLKATNALAVFASDDSIVAQVVKNSLDALGAGAGDVPQVHKMPLFDALFPGGVCDPTFPFVPSAELDLDANAAVYHSSGTTSIPKPIYWTHRALYNFGELLYHGTEDAICSTIACHGSPLERGMGILLLSMPAVVGVTIVVFKPQFPPVAPNSDNCWEGLQEPGVDYVTAAPMFIEEWARNPEKVKALTKLKGVIFGGAPLSKTAGDICAAAGVNLCMCYACTQTAIISEFIPRPPGMDWEYFKLTDNRVAQFEDRGNNEYEIVVLATDTYAPNVVNATVSGKPAYITGDLVEPHPTKPGYYKVIGRADDVIVHSTGEKTNAGMLESFIMGDPAVKGAVIFGRGRRLCGILIEPAVATSSEAEALASVWPSIERMNEIAPKRSRIFKEMILIAKPSKPLERSVKGNIRRLSALDLYADEIEALYTASEAGAQKAAEAPQQPTTDSLRVFVQSVVVSVVGANNVVGPDDDVFELGVDSLQASWIQRTIQRAISEVPAYKHVELPSNVVYKYPTVRRLATFLMPEAADGHQNGRDIDEDEDISALIGKYSSNFPRFVAPDKETRDGGMVILLTGSTGTLGSHILQRLLSSASVRHVYVLSRPASGATPKERVVAAFKREGFDAQVLDDSRVSYLAGNPADEFFDVGGDAFNQMQASVTHIIHNAWRVNFNNSLSSFKTNIVGVRKLVDFALTVKQTRPAHLVFVSSIGVVKHVPETEQLSEKYYDSVTLTAREGYSASKWVSEKIIENAVRDTQLKATVVRPGQIAGGANGYWRSEEWFPSLIKTSVGLGKLPTCEGTLDWIPADVVAGAIVDLTDASATGVFHLVHPKPIEASLIFKTFSTRPGLDVVPYDAWYDALKQAYVAVSATSQSGDMDRDELEKAFEKLPALRLLDFFASSSIADGEFGVRNVVNERAVKASRSLREAPPLGVENVERWIKEWSKSA